MTIVKYKGYTIKQADTNNHYKIFDKNNKRIMHCYPHKKLSKKELKQEIIDLIELLKTTE